MSVEDDSASRLTMAYNPETGTRHAIWVDEGGNVQHRETFVGFPAPEPPKPEVPTIEGRYQVTLEAEHSCCFEALLIDTAIEGDNRVGEFFSLDAAIAVARTLNAATD